MLKVNNKDTIFGIWRFLLCTETDSSLFNSSSNEGFLKLYNSPKYLSCNQLVVKTDQFIPCILLGS